MNWIPLPKKAPKEPGVYAVFLDGRLVYIGKSGCLRARIGAHAFAVCCDEGRWMGNYFKELHVKIRPCVCIQQATRLESLLIKRLRPACNKQGNPSPVKTKAIQLKTRPNNVFCNFVDSVGGQANAAQMLGLSTSHMSLLYNGKRRVTVDLAQRIHIATNGRFNREALVFAPSRPVNPHLQHTEG